MNFYGNATSMPSRLRPTKLHAFPIRLIGIHSRKRRLKKRPGAKLEAPTSVAIRIEVESFETGNVPLSVDKTSSSREIRSLQFAVAPAKNQDYAMLKVRFVVDSILAFISALRVFFRSRSDTALEVLALRQQVAVLKRKRARPILNPLDRFFWTVLRRCWPRWANVLVIVKPETVIRWHRAGFRLFWRWR